MKKSNNDKSFDSLLRLAIEKTLTDLKNTPLVRKIIISRMNEKEIAELSLVFAGECDLSLETSNKIDAIWLVILNEIDPALCEYVKSRKY